jgi:hypothetical protein
VQFQLRLYTIAEDRMDVFVREWEQHVRPLRLALGFSVIGPWVAEDGVTFVWILGHEGDFEAADATYYASPERAGLDPDPADHVVESRTWLMRSPWRARSPGR